MIKVLRIFLLILLSHAAGPSVLAQRTDVMLTGIVADSCGNRLSGAEISIQQTQLKTWSRNDGIYNLSVVPGAYDICVVMEGFQPAQIRILIPEEDFIEESFVLQQKPVRPVPFIPGRCVVISGGDRREKD